VKSNLHIREQDVLLKDSRNGPFINASPLIGNTIRF